MLDAQCRERGEVPVDNVAPPERAASGCCRTPYVIMPAWS